MVAHFSFLWQWPFVLQTLWGHDFVIPIVDNMILIFLDNHYLKISVCLTDSRFMFWDDTDIGGYPLSLLCWGMQFLLGSVLGYKSCL